MVLFIENTITGERKFYRLQSLEDLREVFVKYPATESIAMEQFSLKEAAQAIADYLSNHNLDAWVDEDLNKSIKNKAVALGLALATTLSPSMGTSINSLPALDASKISHGIRPDKDSFGSHPEDQFLWNIMQIESSGGKNVNHPTVKYGISKGDRAIGRWGLLPNTIKDISNRMRAQGKLTPEIEKLASMDRDSMANHLNSNPHIELKLARFLANHVIKRNKGDLKRSAYAWNTGHNLFPSDITDDHILNSDYVAKFSAAHKVNPFVKVKPKAIAMNKAESETDFRSRFKNWRNHREELKRSPQPRTTDYAPDPGRQRDAKLDEKKADSQLNSIDKIKQAVKDINSKNS